MEYLRPAPNENMAVMNVNLNLTKGTGLPVSILHPGAFHIPAEGALLNVGSVMGSVFVRE